MYPGAQSSVRFERLREGIQDYEKIRIIRKDLAEKGSPEAADALASLDSFLLSIDSKTADNQSVSEVINRGKILINTINY
mgnify:CR=1 FL=1